APGADAVADLRARLGLRLRALVELARRLHRVPEAQDRGGGPTAPRADGARRRVRAARAVSFRARLTLVAAVAVAVVVVVLAPATYLVVRSQLYRQIDRTLETRAAVLQRLPLEIDH